MIQVRLSFLNIQLHFCKILFNRDPCFQSSGCCLTDMALAFDDYARPILRCEVIHLEPFYQPCHLLRKYIRVRLGFARETGSFITATESQCLLVRPKCNGHDLRISQLNFLYIFKIPKYFKIPF